MNYNSEQIYPPDRPPNKPPTMPPQEPPEIPHPPVQDPPPEGNPPPIKDTVIISLSIKNNFRGLIRSLFAIGK